MINSIFQKLAGLNSAGGKTKTTTDQLYYRVIVNSEYVTDWKLYEKGKSEADAVKLGGRVNRMRMTKREFDNYNTKYSITIKKGATNENRIR